MGRDSEREAERGERERGNALLTDVSRSTIYISHVCSFGIDVWSVQGSWAQPKV